MELPQLLDFVLDIQLGVEAVEISVALPTPVVQIDFLMQDGLPVRVGQRFLVGHYLEFELLEHHFLALLHSQHDFFLVTLHFFGTVLRGRRFVEFVNFLCYYHTAVDHDCQNYQQDN